MIIYDSFSFRSKNNKSIEVTKANTKNQSGREKINVANVILTSNATPLKLNVQLQINGVMMMMIVFRNPHVWEVPYPILMLWIVLWPHSFNKI